MDTKEQKLIDARDEAHREWDKADCEWDKADCKRCKADHKWDEADRELREYRESEAQQGGKAGE